MTQEAFIKVLDSKDYYYKMKGDRIVVTHKWSVDLRSLTSLPPGVEFRNGGTVNLDSLTSLPPGVVFKNEITVYLSALRSLPPGVEFRNGGEVYLESLIDGWFNEWSGNIEGIDEKRLLNKMIKDGVFER